MKKDQARTAKVLVALMASMTVGGVVLMTLDNHEPARGAYSLASYLRLDSVEEVTLHSMKAQKAAWDGIEIFYSHTNQGDLAQLRGQGLTGFHFLVCNGNGAEDGQIEYTQNWANQNYIAGSDGVIRICVIADRKSSPATGSQLKRISALIESLSQSFSVSPDKILYPAYLQL